MAPAPAPQLEKRPEPIVLIRRGSPVLLSYLRAVGLKLLLLLTSVGLTLAALEGLFRLLDLETASYNSIGGFCRYDPDLGWNLVPGRRTFFKGRHFSVAVETSEQGLRDRFYPLEPEIGRRRVLVIGDSVVWCWGVAIEQCFTELIESRLNETDVITMGVPGFSTAQELLLYERDGRGFNADMVLLVVVGNDLEENLNPSMGPRFVLNEGELMLTNHPVPRIKSPVKEILRQHSRLYAQLTFGSQVGRNFFRTLRGSRAGARQADSRAAATDVEPTPTKVRAPKASKTRPRYVEPIEDVEHEAWALTEALLERFHASVRQDGAELVLVAMDLSFATELREFCEARGLLLIDPRRALYEAEVSGKTTRLRGDPHIAPEGQVVLADAILASLARRDRLER